MYLHRTFVSARYSESSPKMWLGREILIGVRGQMLRSGLWWCWGHSGETKARAKLSMFSAQIWILYTSIEFPGSLWYFELTSTFRSMRSQFDLGLLWKVARCQGGSNAGHTIKVELTVTSDTWGLSGIHLSRSLWLWMTENLTQVGENTYKFHLLPSGIWLSHECMI